MQEIAQWCISENSCLFTPASVRCPVCKVVSLQQQLLTWGCCKANRTRWSDGENQTLEDGWGVARETSFIMSQFIYFDDSVVAAATWGLIAVACLLSRVLFKRHAVALHFLWCPLCLCPVFRPARRNLLESTAARAAANPPPPLHVSAYHTPNQPWLDAL